MNMNLHNKFWLITDIKLNQFAYMFRFFLYSSLGGKTSCLINSTSLHVVKKTKPKPKTKLKGKQRGIRLLTV